VELLVSFGQSAVTVVLFFVMLGVLVVIHEIGHFVAARLAGIRVHEFGIGFPPRARVVGRDHETVYTLNWLPIGGFVRLEGEEGDADDPRSFIRASLPVRLVVILAGVAMNVLLAFVILLGIAWLPQTAYGLAFDRVQADSPAAAAGLGADDLIVEIDGRRFDQVEAQLLVETLRGAVGRTVTLGVVRGGDAPGGSASTAVEPLVVTLRPASEIDEGRGALGIEVLRFAPSAITFTRDPLAAVGVGWERTVDAFFLIAGGLGDVLGSIVRSPTEAPAASGPVGIAVAVGDVFWGAGLVATLYLAAILSANLALVNLLPFPPLDGGRIAMMLARAIAGRRFSVRLERLAYTVGFVALFGFIIWITIFDIARLGGAVQ
jgi:regulator of sigma E protease